VVASSLDDLCCGCLHCGVRGLRGKAEAGSEIGGADKLPNEFYAGSEKFRQLVQSRGNFTWGGEGGAGNTELQLLQWDVTEAAAYREIKLIQYCGWHEIKPAEGKSLVPKREPLDGRWFFDECAITPDNGFLLPDDDGIYWFEGLGYALSRRGRESQFTQGRPQLHPKLAIADVPLDRGDWEQPGSDQDHDDWHQGYCYQFWRCTHNAFRGDGAGGQLCAVIPDKDTVIAITADTGNFQGEMNAIWDKLYPAFQAEALPADATGQEKLKQVIAKLAVHPQKKG